MSNTTDIRTDRYYATERYINRTILTSSNDKSECREIYCLRHRYREQLFMKDSMPGIANYAQKYHDEHPDEPVKIGLCRPRLGMCPESVKLKSHEKKKVQSLCGKKRL